MFWVSVRETSSSIASGGAGKPAIGAARSMVCGSTPSSSSAAASVSSVPKTREVKKPRLSLTTIGVFLICCTTSKARARSPSEVFAPRMISTSGILSTGEKKCMPTKSSGRSTAAGELGDRQRRGVRGEQRVGVHDVLHLAEHAGLERRVLEDRLDHGVAAGQVGRVGGRGDPGEDLGLLLRGHLPAADRLVEERRGVRLALLGGLEADVLEHDVDAGAGRGVGDAGAHHPGAEHAEPGRGELLDALRTQAPELIACRSKKNAWIMFLEFWPTTSWVR